MHLKYLAATALSALVALPLAGCSSGPATKDQVCSSFDALGNQLLQGNGSIGNPLFHKAGDLADVASRYQGSPSLAADAAALKKIAKSDSTGGPELMRATTHVANLCGHPLGTNALFGGK
jgi:hypothetical protein